MATVNGVIKKFAKVIFNEVVATHGEYDFSEGAEWNLEGSAKYDEIIEAFKNELFTASNAHTYMKKHAEDRGVYYGTTNEADRYYVLSQDLDEVIEKTFA